jgi:hypothetical protein
MALRLEMSQRDESQPQGTTVRTCLPRGYPQGPKDRGLTCKFEAQYDLRETERESLVISQPVLGGDSILGYENCIEYSGRHARVIWRNMVPPGSQCVPGQFYDRANSVGGLRRHCRDSWYRFVARS